MRLLSLLVVSILAAGCSCSNGAGAEDAGLHGFDGALAIDGTVPDLPGLRSLRIDPPSATIADNGVAPGETTTFRAIGTFDDGERDVTSMVAWALAVPDLAAIDRGI